MRYELRVLLLLAVFFGLIVWFMPKAEGSEGGGALLPLIPVVGSIYLGTTRC